MAEFSILLLLAGIVDPKHRLTGLRAPGDGRANDDAGLPRVLSPFDEAALQVALRLRETAPGARLAILVTGGAETDALVRAVGAYRPDSLHRLACMPQRLWDPALLARALPHVMAGLGAPPDIVLMPREFGDCDDGLLPPYVAEANGLAYVGLAERVAWQEGRFRLSRACAGGEEDIVLSPPLLASVTNAKANRLRHPLFKNVVLAKRDAVRVCEVPNGDVPSVLALAEVALAAPPARARGGCRFLEGDEATQAAALARALTAGARP